MGNRNSRTPVAPNRKKGEAAEGVGGLRQHENPATTWSRGSQKSASAKPKEFRIDRNKKFSEVILASDTLTPTAFFSASLKRSLSSRERSANRRSSSTRVTGSNGSAPAPPDRARRPSRGGVHNQDIKLTICCQRAPKSGWDNSVFGTSNHQASCGLEGGASPAKGACQGMFGSTARVRLPLAPGVSDETLRGQENFCRGDRRVPRGGSLTFPRKSRRGRSDAKPSGARTRSSTPPVVKCWERTSKKKVVVTSTRKSVVSDQDSAGARVQGIADKIPLNVQRERRVIIGRNGSVGTRRKGATSGRMLSEGARVRRHRSRDSMQTRRGTYTALDKEDEPNENMCPPLHVPGAEGGAEGEVLSVSSANSMTPEGLTVSVSSLPPVETAATGTELIFDESSFEDSLASLSLPSSSDKNGFEVGVGEGGETDEHRRGERGRPHSRHRGSSDTFGRTRSTGSFNLARIHEQKEGRRVYRPSEGTIARNVASRDSDGECVQLQELSDSGNETFEEGSSTVSVTSPTVSPPWNALNIATPTVNFWHHRAALELRNMTLEREVEQLKIHLRDIGGTDVDIPRQETRRSILPPRQQRRGERATDTSGVTATLRKVKTFGSTGAPTPASVRSMARFSLPETPKPINLDPNRGSGEGGDGTNRRKITSERERKSSDPPKQGEETPAARNSHNTGPGENDSIYITEPVPSSQSKCDQHLSDTRTLNMPEVPGGALSTATVPWTCSPSSARQLRTARPPAPESTTEVVGAEGKTARLGVARGSLVFPARSEHGKESVSQLESLGLTVATQTEHDKQSRNTPATPTTVTTKKPLPRLGVEEMRQRRILLDHFQANKVPINLGVKHTMLEGQSQRIGATSEHLASPSSTEQTTATPVPGRGGSVGGGGAGGDTDEFRPLPLQIIADRTCSHDAGHLEDTVASEQSEGVDRKWTPRPPSQTRTVDSVSPLAIAAPTVVASWTSTMTTTKSSLTASQNRQSLGSPLSRETHAEEAEGPRDAASVSETSTNRSATGSEGGIQIQTAAEIATIFSDPDAETPAENIIKASAAGVQEEAGRSKSATPVETTAKLGEMVQTVPPPRVAQEGYTAAKNTSDRERWPARLDARWAEVEFMLCHQVDCEETLKRTAKAAKEGLVFMDKLEKKAQELGVLKGQLSRWLLPFNADTSVEQQQAVTPRRVKESLMASSTTSAGGGVGALSEKEAQYLTNSARKLRQLVRLKIADDNDLNTAREALITMAGFFDSISEEASRRGRTTTAFDILQERRAISPISRPSLLPSKPRSSAAGLVTVCSSSAGAVDHTPVALFASSAKCEEGSSANSGQSALRSKKATCEVMRLLPMEENENRPELSGGGDARRGGGGGGVGCSFPPARAKARTAPAAAASTTKRAISHKDLLVTEEGGTTSCAGKVVPKATEGEPAIKLDKTFMGSKVIVPAVSSRQAISSAEVTQKLEQAATRVTERSTIARAKERLYLVNSGAVRTKSGAIDQVYSDRSRGLRAPAAEGILKPGGAWPSADAASVVSPYSKKTEGTPRTEAGGMKGVSPPALERFKRRRKKT